MQLNRLQVIKNQLICYRQQLLDILVHKKHEVNLKHKELRGLFYKFVSLIPKPTIEEKAQINQQIRANIVYFINQYILPKVKVILEKNDPYYFVEQFSQIWPNFQRFAFAHDFVVEKLKQFFQTFYKMNIAKDFQSNGQIVPVAVIAVNQLKVFLHQTNLINIFPSTFSSLIVIERMGTILSRDQVKEAVSAIESTFFDFDAMIRLDQNRRPVIIKNPSLTGFILRRTKDSQYFQDAIMPKVLQDCRAFYLKLIEQKVYKMSPPQQIDMMLKIIRQQQARAEFYIHTVQNRRKYLQVLNQTLIGEDIHKRLNKEGGLANYLREFHPEKPEFVQQLKNFWTIYSRLMNVCLPIISDIYSQYLDQEAVVAEQKIQKFLQFIPQMMRINSKNIHLIQIFDQNFTLQNIRNDKIRGMLSNQIIKNSRFKGKHTMGATNLALYLNIKFKEMYGKGEEGGAKQIITNLELLFRILQEKVHFTKEHEKQTANRLLEDLDFSKDNEYSRSISLQKGFIEEMQKQMGRSQVKELLQNIKDIEKSVDHTKKLKEQIGSKIHLMNQIVVKNNTFWPERTIYEISPPSVLLKVSNEVESYFLRSSTNIQFEYNNGVSLFQGKFKSPKVPKQNFYLKNIYMIILLLLDETEEKKILYGDLKSKIKSFGSKRDKANLQLVRAIIQLLHIGLLVSGTKKLSKQDPKSFKILQSDELQLNRKFDYEEQMRKNKVPPNFIKKLTVIRNQHMQMLPDWLKKLYVLESNQLAEDQINIQKERRIRVKQIAVKTLKHAHHSNKVCSFEQLYKQYDIPKNRQYHVKEKYLKQILEELINDQYCQRVEGIRNSFKYKA